MIQLRTSVTSKIIQIEPARVINDETRCSFNRMEYTSMNWINFIRLIRTIYSRKLPDITLIESLGLLAVKIGQTYALRLDFLPEQNCKELTRLYRHTDSLTPASYKKLLDSAVEPNWINSFTSINEEPLASASVGQVHRAVLNNGKLVVVKLIKHDFVASFTRDVRSLRS
ncbi:MAG: AarF/UbiB family protein, partial [Fibrobacterota bacterium]